MLTTLGMFAVPVTAETTIGEIRQKVQEWKPEYSLERMELVCKDSDACPPSTRRPGRPTTRRLRSRFGAIGASRSA